TATITKQETSGRHTTTNATLYHLNFESNLIDCPGLQEFGLYHLEISQVANYFPELHPYLGKCKFSNCIHINEPNCAIKTNLAEIDSSRYEYYVRLVTSLQRKNKY
ncbi:MAG: ribosome small subunit-dependent GTPase, partial [Pseudomonadota bacterium]